MRKPCFYGFMLVLFLPSITFAHALHPDSIDRFAEITLTPSHLVLIYQLVLGINPTEEASKLLDSDNDKRITDPERDAYLAQAHPKYLQKQILTVNGQAIPLEYRIGDAYAILGHNGIYAIKVELGFTGTLPADLPRDTTLELDYQDKALVKIPGWKQMQLVAKNGVQYSGHVPYREYKPFDYEILNTKGFSPSTDALHLQVLLPNVTKEQAPSLSLPEKTQVLDLLSGVQVREVNKPQSSFLFLSLMILILLIILSLGAGWIWWRWRSRRLS